MTLALAAAGPSAYWYLARGTGVVSLVLLTASVVLGVLGSLRFSAAPRWPRFAIDTLHRDVSLLVLVVLVVHIVTSVLDSFAPITLRRRGDPVPGSLPAAVAGVRRAVVRPADGARRSRACVRRRLGYARLAGDPLARLRELAGGGAARARDGQRHEGVVDAGADRRCASAAVLVAMLVRISRGPMPSEAVRGAGARSRTLADAARASRSSPSPGRFSAAGRGGPERRSPCSAPTQRPVAATPLRRGVSRRRATSRTLKVPFSAWLRGKRHADPRSPAARSSTWRCG